jgi:hypothetical protein
MRVCFQDGAIHKGTGVAFIGIADYIFGRACGSTTGLPFLSGRKTGTTTPSKPGSLHLANDLLRCHFEESLLQCPITSTSNIMLDFFGVDMPAVTQDDALLFLIEVYLCIVRYGFASNRVTVEKAFHGFAFTKMRADNFWSILGLDMGIENALGFDDYIGALLTETVAAREIHLGMAYPLSVYFFLKRLIDSIRAAGKASCSLTNKNSMTVRHTTLYPPDF